MEKSQSNKVLFMTNKAQIRVNRTKTKHSPPFAPTARLWSYFTPANGTLRLISVKPAPNGPNRNPIENANGRTTMNDRDDV